MALLTRAERPSNLRLVQPTRPRETLGISTLPIPTASLALLCVVLSCGKPSGNAAPPSSSSVISTAQAAPGAPAAASGKVDVSSQRMAYDLLANRVHAILHLGGRMVLSAGSVDFYKFVDGGWKGSWILGQKDGTSRVASISGSSASIGFPLDVDGDGAAGKALSDLQMTIVMRSLTPGQKVSIFANEKPVTTIDVSKDRATYDVTLPAASLVLNVNVFCLPSLLCELIAPCGEEPG